MTKEITSSTIQQIEYNTETNALVITFKSGGSYEYADVPVELVESFQSAESAGSFFHKNIRGEYESKKISS